METTTICCACKRPVKSEQDFVFLYGYPLVCMDTEYCHLLCFRIRVSQANNLMVGLEHNVHYAAARPETPPNPQKPPSNMSCGYCSEAIIEDEDSICYKLCKHGHVHMRCASLVNFVRRTGCPYCYSAAEDRRSLLAWMDIPERRTITASTSSSQARAAQNAKADRVLDMFVDNAVKDILMANQPCGTLIESYSHKLPYMREPTYPTLMRQLSFELNFSETGVDDRHIRQQETGILPLMIKQYQLSELGRMGLSMPMIMYNQESLTLFIANFLYEGVLPPGTWNFNFIQLLLAGTPLPYFSDRNYTMRGPHLHRIFCSRLSRSWRL